MKLELLTSESTAERMLRLQNFSAADATAMKGLCRQLASGRATRIDLSGQPWMSVSGGLHVEMVVGTADEGVVSDGRGGYRWTLRAEVWDDVADFIEPLMAEGGNDGYQWLDERGEMCVLMSRTGEW